MKMRLTSRERPLTRIVPLSRRPSADGRIYPAGDVVCAGLYEDVERKIVIRLSQAMPLPDLNSLTRCAGTRPSRFFRRTPARGLLRWMGRRGGSLDMTILYRAGQPVSAGLYRDVERGVEVRLEADGPLPDLQTGTPSRYRRMIGGRLSVRRQ